MTDSEDTIPLLDPDAQERLVCAANFNAKDNRFALVRGDDLRAALSELESLRAQLESIIAR